MGREGPFSEIKFFNKIYLNTANNFDTLYYSGVNQKNGESIVGDFDNDTDLDVLVMSYDDVRLFRNNISQKNAKPSIPSDLAVVKASNHITFSWNKSTDSNQIGAIKYNIRIGTSPGGTDIVSPMANLSNGFYKKSPHGIINQTAWNIKTLLPGTYFWSVQSIDNSESTSTFATEASFTIDPVPDITSFTPTNGIVGSIVIISGSNFLDARSVKFDGVEASYTVINATTISAYVPVGAATGKVSVATLSGTSTSITDFSVTSPAPLITSITPSNGKYGSSVTITGTNFKGATSVKFNGTTTAYTVVNSSTINTIVPNDAITGKITVTTPYGTAISESDFIVENLVISSFTPTSNSVNGTVTITGNFPWLVGVEFNGVNAFYTYISPTIITAIVPRGATNGKISIRTHSGKVLSTNDFIVTPIITDFEPLSGASGSLITLRGYSFTDITSLKFNGVIGTYTVINDSVVTAIVPEGAISGKIAVVTPTGTATTDASFMVTLPTPTIADFTPKMGLVGSAVTITGKNFTGVTAVKFNGISTIYSINNSSQITASVPAGATTGKITVTTVSGTATSVANYAVTLPAPSISNFTPESGLAGSVVTITGTNFTGATAVKFNGTTGTYILNNSNQITTSVPAGATTGKITVTTVSGTATSIKTYTVILPTPTISGFTPAMGTVASSLTITGTNFTGATAVKFNGISASYKVTNSTQITTSVPAGATTGKITVTTVSGTATSAINYIVTLPAPVIAGFTPTSGIIGSAVTITGDNLTGVTSVKFNGIVATFAIRNNTEINTIIPIGASTGKISVSNGQTLVLSNSDFIVTPGYSMPSITSFSPLKALPGVKVSILGKNFEAISSVKFNNVDADFNVVNTNLIMASVPVMATSGKISIANVKGTVVSVADFIVLVEIEAPSNLVAIGEESSITLSWTDNSENEDGFIIEKFINNSVQFLKIDTVRNNVNLYIDNTIKGKGKNYYRVYAYQGVSTSGYTNTATGELGEVTGMEDLYKAGIRIYPNPFIKVLNIELKVGAVTRLVITDILGKVIVDIDRPIEHQVLPLDLSHLERGVYILRVISGAKTQSIKLIKE